MAAHITLPSLQKRPKGEVYMLASTIVQPPAVLCCVAS
jgi:hypothetical protein